MAGGVFPVDFLFIFGSFSLHLVCLHLYINQSLYQRDSVQSDAAIITLNFIIVDDDVVGVAFETMQYVKIRVFTFVLGIFVSNKVLFFGFWIKLAPSLYFPKTSGEDGVRGQDVGAV